MSEKIRIFTESRQFLADTLTPVSIFLNLRSRYTDVLLLESSDYRGKENSVSYLCANPLVRFEVRDYSLKVDYDIRFGRAREDHKVVDVISQLEEFHQRFNFEETDQANSRANPAANIFGYTGFNSFKYFDDLTLPQHQDKLPDLRYDVFEYVIEFNHFNNQLTVFCNCPVKADQQKQLAGFIELARGANSHNAEQFELKGDETSNLTDAGHIEIINQCKQHIARGDVFQMVASRQFRQKFAGDDFQVYRALRSVNPSPFLFYFSYENFRIFGSSPELQIKIRDAQASIHPIAGTYKRNLEVGDDETATRLLNDPKESSEHIMLVDLARNDLSRHCNEVKVEKFMTVEFYSHVVHLVSKVNGNLDRAENSKKVFADTFPAGTLSGAPKYKAIELIARYEPTVRSFYGGAIGFMCQNGDIIHAILIRSFLSVENELVFQAGAGIVADSNPQAEVEEVVSKLGALRKAIKIGSQIS